PPGRPLRPGRDRRVPAAAGRRPGPALRPRQGRPGAGGGPFLGRGRRTDAGGLPGAAGGTGRMTRVAFLVNGGPDSAMGRRARDFADRLRDRYEIAIAYRSGRKVLSIARFAAFLARVRPRVCYVFDMG